MLKKLYPYRFQIFFFSQIIILFGSLVVPEGLFEKIMAPLLFPANLLAGILLISKNNKLMWFFVALLIIGGVVLGISVTERESKPYLDFIRMGTFFLFYTVVTLEIIKQVWRSKAVNKNVIFGLMSGYISLGLIGFFICLSIQMLHPDSFQGLLTTHAPTEMLTERLMYYSFITLLTIGYGDIVPITPLAHKAAILIGLMGQFYLVIITAVVVEKYLKHNTLR